MFRLKYYLGLSVYPIIFFSVLAAIQYGIIWNAYKQKASRQSRPYVNGAPLPEPEFSVDRRPQSINIPSLELDRKSSGGAKTDRVTPAQ